MEVSTLVTISFKKCCMSSQNKATQGEAVFVGGRGVPLWVVGSDCGLPLPELDNNSGYGRDVFLISFGDIPGMFVLKFQTTSSFLYVCQSVSWPPSLLKLDQYNDISSSG